jgi:adenine-specific DNA-methyltransferase
MLAGFSVDPEAQPFIQKAPIKSLRVHFANVNPDVLVRDLPKTSRPNQLFTLRLHAVLHIRNVFCPRREA